MIKSKSKYLIIFLIIGLFAANFASAAIVNCGGYNADGSKQASCTVTDLIGTIRLIISYLLSWAWLVSIIYVVWSGIQMVLSAGNEEAVSKAKTSLTYAITGFVVILLSFVILNFVVVLITGGRFNFDTLINSFNLVP